MSATSNIFRMFRTRKFTVLLTVLVIVVTLNVLINLEKGNTVESQTLYLSKIFFQESDKIINPHDYKYIINTSEDICTSSKNLTLVALVTSASYNFLNREAIRKTWADKQKFPGLKKKEKFFFNVPLNSIH